MAAVQDQRPTIVIAGGGTAGWMVAAAFARFLGTTHRLRLVESDEIGTIGVGEATIPQIRLFKDALGLDEDALLKATDGTFKLGIEFVGWREPGHRYMHAFGGVGRDVGLIAFQHYWLRARKMGVARSLDAYALNEIAALKGRMHRGGPLTARAIPDMPYAYHFDASLFARMLRAFAEAQGVERTEGRILGAELDEGGEVAALALDGERRIEGDLFIDCTGFRALLIEQALQTGFEDWSHWLPCDRALAAPSARTEPLLPYTRATARAAGWQWRIPLQHRTGNGLVYCGAHIADDEAAQTLLANLDGAPIADPRPLRFTTGKRRLGWNRNVIAMGLSSGFLEPLESTSIHLIQSAISRLLQLLPGRAISDADRREYNRQTDFEMERVRDFLILHYAFNQRPEPFWQACRTMALPDTLTHKLELFAANGRIVREHEELFTEVGWLQVLIGQGAEPQGYHPLADAIEPGDLAEYMRTIEALYAREADAMPRHEDFIARFCAAQNPAVAA
jgi:tryptophan halogenase